MSCSDVEQIDAIMRLFNWFNSDITIMKKFEIFRELSKRDADNRREQIRLTKWRPIDLLDAEILQAFNWKRNVIKRNLLVLKLCRSVRKITPTFFFFFFL